MHIRPLVLRTVVFFIVLNAAVAAATLFSGEERFGDIDGNVMMTTLIVTAAGLLFLVCFLAHEDRRPRPLPALPAFAVAAILVGLVLVLLHVWADIESTLLDRATLTVMTVAFGASLICLISLASLRFPYAGVQVAAALLAVALAAMAIYMVWNPDRTDQHWRLAALLAVLTASTTQVIPVMSYLLKVREPAGRRGTPRRPSYCPNCGAVLHMDDPYCLACGVSFRVEFLRERRMNPYQRQAVFAQQARELAEQEAEEDGDDLIFADDGEAETAPLLPDRPALNDHPGLDAEPAPARSAVIDGQVESTSVIPAPTPWSRADIGPPGDSDEALDLKAFEPPPIDPLLDPAARAEDGSNGAATSSPDRAPELDDEANEALEASLAVDNVEPLEQPDASDEADDTRTPAGLQSLTPDTTETEEDSEDPATTEETADVEPLDQPDTGTEAGGTRTTAGLPSLTPDKAEAEIDSQDSAKTEDAAQEPEGFQSGVPDAETAEEDTGAAADNTGDTEEQKEPSETAEPPGQGSAASGGKKRRSRRRKSRR